MKQEIATSKVLREIGPAPSLSASELLTSRPEASKRFRSFLTRCDEETIEYAGMRYQHMELVAVTESGLLIHLRRVQGLATNTAEANFYLEIGSLVDDTAIATIKTVRETPDGDGAALYMLFDLPQRTFVLELSQTSCLLHDVSKGATERAMHYMEMIYRTART